MIQNPHLIEPSRADAWAEGFTKGFFASRSPEPGENVGTDDMEAFNEGVAAGLEANRKGFGLDDPCVSAAEASPGEVVSTPIDVAHIAHGVWEVAQVAKLAAGVGGIIVGLIGLAISLPVHTLPPEQVLPAIGQPEVDALAAYGFDSLELFCGAGLDATATDCEILLTPLFPTQDQAQTAVVALRRPTWVIVRWRTDQCRSFAVVDSSPA